ncbi:hypothetical protein, partial [Alistipes finegoldii]|uniref:hypothetical protein n=2 Tax=Alistipes finegoldii TaxID=214856 RepID=UPI003FD6DC41
GKGSHRIFIPYFQLLIQIIYRYEAGRKIPNIMSIRKICELYNITIREFFDIDSFDYPPKTGKIVERIPSKE